MRAVLGSYFLANVKDFEERVAVRVQDDAGLLRHWFGVGMEPMRATDLAILSA